MLRPSETDPLGTELACETAFLRRVRVDPDAEGAALVGPHEQLDELLLFAEVRLDRRELTEEDLAGRSVDRDRVALAHDLVADTHLPLREIDVERRDAGDAREAQTARDDRGMTGRAAAGRQDAGRRDHPVEVVGTRFGAHEHDELFGSLELDGAIRVEHGAPGRGAG